MLVSNAAADPVLTVDVCQVVSGKVGNVQAQNHKNGKIPS